jgi:hypothetical protein
MSRDNRRNLKRSEAALLSAVRFVLFEHWDPIGVRGIPAAADEYDTYAQRIVSMLMANSTVEEMRQYLTVVEQEQMALNVDETRVNFASEELSKLRKN